MKMKWMPRKWKHSCLVHVSTRAGELLRYKLVMRWNYQFWLIISSHCRKLLPQGLVIWGPYCLKLLPRSKYSPSTALTISLSVCRGGDYKFMGLTVKTEISLQQCRCFMQKKTVDCPLQCPVQLWFYYIYRMSLFENYTSHNMWLLLAGV